MKTIAIDAQATVGKSTGLGVYTRHLTQSLMRLAGQGAYDDLSVRLYRDESRQSMRTHERLIWENFVLPKRVRADRPDLLHVPAFAAPLRKPARLVMTVHDLIGMLYPNQIGIASRFYWGSWLPWSVKQADAVIADSESTKRDLVRVLKLEEQKIRVIYPSGHEGFCADLPADRIDGAKARFGIQGKYFLFVGTIEPRKNLAGTVRAFAEFTKKYETAGLFQLVVVGAKSFAHGKFFEEMARDSDTSRVVFTDYVDHDSLNALYCGCEAFVYPSFYEGFGIPVLEAMASGAPVIASSVSSVPEVAGDAAVLVDPSSVTELANAMARMVSDEVLRSRLVQAGRRQIQKFSWNRTATETIGVYRSVLEG